MFAAEQSFERSKFPPSRVITPGIENDSDDDNHPRDNAFHGFGSTYLRQAGFEGGDDEYTKKAFYYRTTPSHQAGATNHHGGDGRQLQADSRIRVRRPEA